MLRNGQVCRVRSTGRVKYFHFYAVDCTALFQDGNVLCCGMSRGAGSVSLTVSISQEGKEEGVGSVVG